MNDNATEEQLDVCHDITVAAGVVVECAVHKGSFYRGAGSTVEAFAYYDEHRAQFPSVFDSDTQAIRFIGGCLADVELPNECFKCNGGIHTIPVSWD